MKIKIEYREKIQYFLRHKKNRKFDLTWNGRDKTSDRQNQGNKTKSRKT